MDRVGGDGNGVTMLLYAFILCSYHCVPLWGNDPDFCFFYSP